MPNEEWSSTPPTCEGAIIIIVIIVVKALILTSIIIIMATLFSVAITCPMLANPANGSVHTDTPPPQPYKTKVNISCNDGYRQEGSHTRVCLRNGTWSGEETNCTCKHIIIIARGSTTQNLYLGVVE